MRRLLLPVLALVALGAGTACGAVEPYAAKVNGTVILQDDLEEELEAIGNNARYVEALEQQGLQVRGSGRGTFDAGFVAQVLTRQVLLEVVHQEAVRRRVEVTQKDRDDARATVVRSYGGEETFSVFPKDYQDLVVQRTAEVDKVQALFGPGVDEAALRRRYEETKQRYTQTCVRHILFSVMGPNGRPDTQAASAQVATLRAQAEQVRAELDAGADFAALAAAHSADPGTKARGGDLGCQEPGQFLPEFEQTMDELEPGQISGPVQTQVGVHLIQVTERKVPPFEEVVDQVRSEFEQQGAQRFQQEVARLASSARVAVNPRYGRFEKEGQPRVAPPTPPEVPGASTPAPSPFAP